MNLYSLSFIYLFLPLSVLVYHAVPARAKNPMLLLISLAFYTLAEPRYLPLMVGSVLLDYACARALERFEGRQPLRTAFMLAVLVKNAWLVIMLSHLTANREIWRPLGVMIYALTSLGYVADVYPVSYTHLI